MSSKTITPKLTPAGIWDALFIYRTRNDVTTRINSFHTERIALHHHIRWYFTALHDPGLKFFILRQGSTRLGYVRLDMSGSIAQISYSIAPNYRKQGYGKCIISLLEQESLPGICELHAYVKPSNTGSMKIFRALHYTMMRQPDQLLFIKRL